MIPGTVKWIVPIPGTDKPCPHYLLQVGEGRYTCVVCKLHFIEPYHVEVLDTVREWWVRV